MEPTCPVISQNFREKITTPFLMTTILPPIKQIEFIEIKIQVTYLLKWPPMDPMLPKDACRSGYKTENNLPIDALRCTSTNT